MEQMLQKLADTSETKFTAAIEKLSDKFKKQ
jgi:hypothetical protein